MRRVGTGEAAESQVCGKPEKTTRTKEETTEQTQRAQHKLVLLLPTSQNPDCRSLALTAEDEKQLDQFHTEP